MEKQGIILAAFGLGAFLISMIPIILLVFLAGGQAVGLIMGAVMLAVLGLGFMISMRYIKKAGAEKVRTRALKDLPSELDAPPSENF